MHSKKARGALALLLVLGLLAATAPAGAAPDRPTGEPSAGAGFLEALTGWIGSFWPVSGSAATAAPASTATDPGAVREPHRPAGKESNGDPTAEPQLGSDIDPNG